MSQSIYKFYAIEKQPIVVIVVVFWFFSFSPLAVYSLRTCPIDKTLYAQIAHLTQIRTKAAYANRPEKREKRSTQIDIEF